MKLRLLLLVGSLILNCTWVAAFALRPTLAPPAIRELTARYFGGDEPRALPAKATAPKGAARKQLWPTLDAGGDLQTLIGRLRSAGFPADVIRAMVLAEMSARYDVRLRAMFESDPSTPFWKTQSSFMSQGDKRMEEYGRLQRERAKLLRELFADPFFASDDVSAGQRRQFGNLPRQKIDLLQRIEDDYAEMSSAIQSAARGIMLPEDREKLALLARERRTDLASVLSPAELADYEMRSSPLTSLIARYLGGFNASEGEFRAIFQAQQAFSERTGPGFTPRNMEERQAAQTQLNDQLKASLGEARFADYLRETDSTYQQLMRLAQRDNIAPQTALQAYNLRDKVADESGRIVDDPVLSPEQKRAELQSLAERTRNELLGLLGPRAGPAYVSIADQRWLRMVQRGLAVSFTGGSGGSMTISSGASGGMPYAASFGVSPNFRSIPQSPASPRP